MVKFLVLWLVDGKDGALGIADCARISLIYAGVPLSTICTSWPVPSRFKLIIKMLLNFSTDALALLGCCSFQQHPSRKRTARLFGRKNNWKQGGIFHNETALQSTMIYTHVQSEKGMRPKRSPSLALE